MDIKVLETVDYEATAKLLYDSYIPQWGAAGSPEWHSAYLEYLDKAYIKPRGGLCVGAYESGSCVGVGFGYINDWQVAEIGKITTLGICNFGVHPEHQRKGIATALVEKLEQEGKAKGAQLAYRICNEVLNDHLGFAKAGYAKKMDNAFQMARIMGKEMIDTTATLKNYGKAMKFLLKAVAGFPKESKKVTVGELRNGTDSDIAACVKLLNAYQDPITQVWTEAEFGSVITNQGLLKRKPFAGIFYVWEVDGTVKGFVVGRFEAIVYTNGIGTSAILIHTGFDQDFDRKDKTSFAVSTLYKVKETNADTFGTNLASAHHEEKAFDKAGFNDDRSTRPLYVKALDAKLNDWVGADWNYKTYCIPYQR
jgi:GNAT superfamily N-acetyltransferase